MVTETLKFGSHSGRGAPGRALRSEAHTGLLCAVLSGYVFRGLGPGEAISGLSWWDLRARKADSPALQCQPNLLSLSFCFLFLNLTLSHPRNTHTRGLYGTQVVTDLSGSTWLFAQLASHQLGSRS